MIYKIVVDAELDDDSIHSNSRFCLSTKIFSPREIHVRFSDSFGVYELRAQHTPIRWSWSQPKEMQLEHCIWIWRRGQAIFEASNGYSRFQPWNQALYKFFLFLLFWCLKGLHCNKKKTYSQRSSCSPVFPRCLNNNSTNGDFLVDTGNYRYRECIWPH